MSERCQHADTVAAFLLGALSEAERREFQTHMATCAHCREDVASLRLVADALPLAVPPVAGPAADKPQRQPQPKRRRRFAFSSGRPLALAGAVGALVLGVVLGLG